MLDQMQISDLRAAAVFRAPLQRNILFALIKAERPLSELARLTESSLSLLHHHVSKFVRLGLVEVVREAPRSGAPIKVYRAAARAYFVPAELMNTDPGAGASSRLRDLLERSLVGTVQGVLYACDERGPRMRLVRDPGPHRMAVELWLDVRLTEAEAAGLAAELKAVLDRYRSGGADRGRRYLVHAALAPA